MELYGCKIFSKNIRVIMLSIRVSRYLLILDILGILVVYRFFVNFGLLLLILWILMINLDFGFICRSVFLFIVLVRRMYRDFFFLFSFFVVWIFFVFLFIINRLLVLFFVKMYFKFLFFLFWLVWSFKEVEKNNFVNIWVVILLKRI